jgi:8-oxo-dGTP pyrophosphatase MutT (NUDIX family)
MSERELQPWRILSSAYRIESPFLRLRVDRVELPNGTVVEDYFVRESRGFCVVFALTDDNRVVLVRQYKHGVGEIILELPAGAIDPGETPEMCARRELLEETGYGDVALQHVRTFFADPTNSDSRFHLFVARGARLIAEPDLDDTEEIEVLLAPIDEVRAMALDGRIPTGSQVAAVLVALASLGTDGGAIPQNEGQTA